MKLLLIIIIPILLAFIACSDTVIQPECEGYWRGEAVHEMNPNDHFTIAIGFRYEGSRLHYFGTIDSEYVQGVAGYSSSGRIVFGAFDGKVTDGRIEGRYDGVYTFYLWRQ
jgi:hypothetical protein